MSTSPRDLIRSRHGGGEVTGLQETRASLREEVLELLAQCFRGVLFVAVRSLSIPVEGAAGAGDLLLECVGEMILSSSAFMLDVRIDAIHQAQQVLDLWRYQDPYTSRLALSRMCDRDEQTIEGDLELRDLVLQGFSLPGLLL